MKTLAYPTAALGLAALLSAVPSAAQDTPLPGRPPTGRAAPPVEDLVQIAVGHAAEIELMRARLDRARELIAPAGALPDTMSTVSYQEAKFPHFGVGTEPMSLVNIEVRQSLLYPGKRDARRDAARADATVQEKEFDLVRAEVASQVRVLYARLYAVDRERAALASASEMLDLLAATTAARYGVGQAEQEAVLKAQLAVTSLGERLDDLAATRTTLAAGLNALLDRPPDTPLGEFDTLPAVTVPGGNWGDLALGGSAAITVRKSEEVAAERRLNVARTETMPNLSIGGGVGIRGALPPVVTFSVGVEWPSFKKQKQEPLIRAAEHDVAVAEHALHEESVRVATELARLSAEWTRADQQIRRYREAILPQTSAVMDAARVAYLNGRGDFSTVVEDFSLWLEARVRLAGREADRYAVWAELQPFISGTAQGGATQGR